MLTVQEDGRTVVIDGNLQLAAIRASCDPAVWKKVKDDSQETRGLQAAARDPVVQTLMMPSRDQAMRARISRQRNGDTMWTRNAHAHHYRELLLAGRPIQEIDWMYSRTDRMTGPYRIHNMVNALNFLEQVNRESEHPWQQGWQFSKLPAVLDLPNVRKTLGLAKPEEYRPDEPPLRGKKSRAEAQELMKILLGSPRGSGEHDHAKFRSDSDISRLDDLYGDRKALENLKSRWVYSVHSAHSLLRGRHDGYEARTKLETLHTIAARNLREMKEDPAGPIAAPGDIHLADTTYELHQDESVQYRVRLISKDPRRDQPVQQKLQEVLKNYDDRTCLVELE